MNNLIRFQPVEVKLIYISVIYYHGVLVLTTTHLNIHISLCHHVSSALIDQRYNRAIMTSNCYTSLTTRPICHTLIPNVHPLCRFIQHNTCSLCSISVFQHYISTFSFTPDQSLLTLSTMLDHQTCKSNSQYPPSAAYS